MPMFVTIGYGDREGYDRTDPTVRDAAHAHDARLQRDGAVMGVAGAPVQVPPPQTVIYRLMVPLMTGDQWARFNRRYKPRDSIQEESTAHSVRTPRPR